MTPDEGDSVRPALELRRPFGWGVFWIADSRATGLPSMGAVRFPSTDTAVAVPVRHSQDVEFDESATEIPEFAVRVVVYLGLPANGEVQFDGEIEVQSGRVSVGDADREDIVDVSGSALRVQVRVAPEDHPEHVEIWLSPPLAQ